MLSWSLVLLVLALLAGVLGLMEASLLGVAACLVLLLLAGAVLDVRVLPRVSSR